jgi:hypothetical protein
MERMLLLNEPVMESFLRKKILVYQIEQSLLKMYIASLSKAFVLLSYSLYIYFILPKKRETKRFIFLCF